ncbi:MAG: OmpA family protein [Flavobacteriales bacterium]|nr:OmpA family protein [Flavobacteriales bacterium]
MRILLISFVIIFSFSGFTQSKKAEKARTLVKDGMMSESRMEYEQSIKLFAKATKVDPTYAQGWYSLGTAYNKIGLNREKQFKAFLKVTQLDSNSQLGLNAYSYLSALYTQSGIFDTAYYYFTKYLEHANFKSQNPAEVSEKKANMEFASNAYLHPIKIDPWPLNEKINDPNALQYFPVLSGDGELMLFTRRMKGSQNEDLYISRYLGDWHEPKKLPLSINSDEAEGTATMSADGNMIVCSYCGDSRESYGNCDLYFSIKKGSDWEPLKNLGATINSKSYDSQPSLSADGRTLFFTSDREGGIGGLDIYYSKRDESDEWAQPVNMGPAINTTKNEGSPFIHSNGQSFFFSSQGHLGMGGYDLYLSEFEKGAWQEARNLGYPINDQNNQLSLFVTGDGKRGFFSKEEFTDQSIMANQSRIFSFNVPVELKLGHRSNYVKGKVFDNLKKRPIGASLKLVNLETGETIGFVYANSQRGDYLMMLPEGAEYAFYAETPGYLFKSIAFDYSEKKNFDPIELDIYLDPIIKGVTVQLSNIYFETGKATLMSKSKIELDKLYKLMKQNPSLKIELGGHTDNTGGDKINLELSQKRVDAVKTHLVNKGIPADRMVGKGYGANKPIGSNDTPEGRKENRRVEFTVLEN